jgi:hypothetical protein
MPLPSFVLGLVLLPLEREKSAIAAKSAQHRPAVLFPLSPARSVPTETSSHLGHEDRETRESNGDR